LLLEDIMYLFEIVVFVYKSRHLYCHNYDNFYLYKLYYQLSLVIVIFTDVSRIVETNY